MIIRRHRNAVGLVSLGILAALYLSICLGSRGFGGCLVCSTAATPAAALLPAGKAAEGSLDLVQQFVSTRHLGGWG